ncbi:MAG TPA: ImmA/IrrE family metallo-endopeptidase [Patescibacteria group bacterium]|nr:ImmA/IrrE family metallo-endopeptidase [Patescibacteria group bacterium]
MKLTPPIDILEVCKAYDLKVYNEDIKSAEAFLIVSQGKKSIIINEKKIPYIPRQRFTIAHEVGHFIIPWHEGQYKCKHIGDFNTSDIHENEANIFASELLVPTASIVDSIKGKTVTLELIKEMAQEYSVSLVAMSRKVIENTDEKVMALFYYSNGNKLVQARSKNFQYALKPGVINRSAAKELLQSRYRNESIKRILRRESWFSGFSGDFDIVEESLCQPTYGRVFTILRAAKDFDYFDAFFEQ